MSGFNQSVRVENNNITIAQKGAESVTVQGPVEYGSYIPVLTGLAGWTEEPTAMQVNFTRVGNSLVGSGTFNARANAAGNGAVTTFNMSLPGFVTNLAVYKDMAGSGIQAPSNQATDGHISLRAIAATATLGVSVYASSTSPSSFAFNFSGIFEA